VKDFLINFQILKDDRSKFLKRWDEENISGQLRRINSMNRDLDDARLRGLVNSLLDYCFKEKEYWKEFIQLDELDYEKILDLQKNKLSFLSSIEFIQQTVAWLFEAVQTWGNIRQYSDKIIEVYEYLIDLIIRSGDLEFIRLIQLDNQLLWYIKNTNNVEERLSKIKEFQFPQMQKDSNTNDLNLLPRNLFLNHPWERELKELFSERSKQYGILKKLTYYRIPQLILWSAYDQRNNEKVISFLIEFILSFLNTWAHFAATCRFRFRMGKRTIKNVILQSNISPGVELLEIFGNIPIVSWISSFLGATTTVIDFHYREGQGEVFDYKSKAMQMIREGDYRGFTNFYREERRKEMMGEGLQSDISQGHIDPYNTLKLIGHHPWLYENIKDNYKAINLNLMNLKTCKEAVQNEKYDRFLIDPPHGIETRYQEADVWTLVSNSIELVKMTAKKNSTGFFVVPPITDDREERVEWRRQLYELLDEAQIYYQEPGRRNRLVSFRFE